MARVIIRHVPARLHVKTCALVYAALIVSASCAAHRSPLLQAGECAFVVYNRTPHALEIRVDSTRMSTPIGAINQGELLSDVAPCTQRWVWVYGIPIPERVGAPVKFPFVIGAAELTPGARASVELTWP